MSKPTPDLEALLAAERAAPGPPPEARARVLARVEATLGIAAGLPAGPPPGTSAATTAAAAGKTTLLAVKPLLILTGAAIAASGTGVALHMSGKAARTPAPVSAPMTERLAPLPAAVPPSPPPPPPAPPPPAVELEVAPPARPAPRRHAAAPAPADLLGRERQWIVEARASLSQHNADAARAALEAHAREFPDGQLAEEREALWVRALIEAGDPEGAKARAEAFRARYPRSIQLPVVEAALRQIH